MKITKIACLMKKNILKNQRRFNTEEINMYTDNKRLQSFDRVAKFPQEALAIKVCENEF